MAQNHSRPAASPRPSPKRRALPHPPLLLKSRHPPVDAHPATLYSNRSIQHQKPRSPDPPTQRSHTLRRYLLIAIGGALGALLRYAIGVFAAHRFGPRFPVGTLTINVSACFLIGFILEYLGHTTGTHPVWRYFFAIGFIGAYSTFSTFEWEIWSDLTSGAYWIGLAYLTASLVLGFLAVALGATSARAFAHTL